MLYDMAQAEDIRNLRAIILSENKCAIDWLRRLGASTQTFRDEITELDMPVCQDPVLLPQNKSSQRFHEILNRIEELSVRPLRAQWTAAGPIARHRQSRLNPGCTRDFGPGVFFVND